MKEFETLKNFIVGICLDALMFYIYNFMIFMSPPYLAGISGLAVVAHIAVSLYLILRKIKSKIEVSFLRFGQSYIFILLIVLLIVFQLTGIIKQA